MLSVPRGSLQHGAYSRQPAAAAQRCRAEWVLRPPVDSALERLELEGRLWFRASPNYTVSHLTYSVTVE